MVQLIGNSVREKPHKSSSLIVFALLVAAMTSGPAWIGLAKIEPTRAQKSLVQRYADMDDLFSKSKVGGKKVMDEAYLATESEDGRFWRQKLREDREKGIAPKKMAAGKAKWKGTRAQTEQSERGRKTNLERLKRASARADTGYLSPLVEITRKIVGEDKLVEMRKAWIQHHTKVISAGVLFAADKNLGRAISKQMFFQADVDKSGQLDKGELFAAVHKAGFSWMTRRKVESLMGNADNDANNLIDYEEFEQIAPSTLRKSFAKLASVRGRWLGLLG